MAGFLIAEEGPLAGLVVRMEEGEEWIIGRDPDVCFQVIEDPMVSRKHVIFHLTGEGYQIENLSAVNPATVNGKTVDTPTLLQEGDTIQIGSIFFRYTEKDPAETPSEQQVEAASEETPTIYEESDELDALAFAGGADARWIIKIISGPNAGAEFGLHEESTYVIGKDPNTCDIIFQDLSVSRQHAEISVTSDGKVLIRDLGSRNKVLVNGLEIQQPTELSTQDLIALGTTSFLVIDREQTRETIVSPSAGFEYVPPSKEGEKEAEVAKTAEEAVKKDWKKMIIPTRHLVLAGLFALLLIIALGGVFSLFKSESVTVSVADESQEVSKALKSFPEVEFSFNPSTGKLFLLGHVMTEVDQQEMMYMLRSLPFIHTIDDNVIIDELVWEGTNAIISKNPNWRGVNLTSIVPGHFVLRGYVQTLDEAAKLAEYINLNFPYLDKLDNQVVVENTLEAQIQSLLLEKRLLNVTFQFSNGELILAGRVGSNHESDFNEAIKMLKKVKGVRMVKNFVIITSPTSDVINITSKYKVTGSSKLGNVSQYVVINGKILSSGDTLDGMKITSIKENSIFLEKDGIKYLINYNQQ